MKSVATPRMVSNSNRFFVSFVEAKIYMVTVLFSLHIQNLTFSHFRKRLQTKALPKSFVCGTSTHLNFFICIIKNEQSKDVCFFILFTVNKCSFLYSFAILYMIAQESKSRLPHLNAIGKLKGHV